MPWKERSVGEERMRFVLRTHVSATGLSNRRWENHPFPFGTRLAGRAVVVSLSRRENEVDIWGSCHEKNRCSCRRHVPSLSHLRSE